MGKIYRRNNLISNVTPKKKREGIRKKSACVNFRVTPEEKEIIFKRIELSGMLVQDYVAQSCMHNQVTAVGNIKTFDAIRREMKIIDQHLLNVQKADELDWKVLESLRAILEILNGFYRKEAEGEKENGK